MLIKKNKKMLKKMIYMHIWSQNKIFQDISKKQAEDKRLLLLEKYLIQNILILLYKINKIKRLETDLAIKNNIKIILNLNNILIKD